ncbi:HAD-IIB family hydrolase [Luteolibacter marinus]|uniref:HAD-IIB family hydrolase n=1 Tax=Luteolibacter marinus TaxID=2776705 RepID=UPI0018672517|nr:HAD family hydrolase [Luteolibacter marinus]
MNSLLTPRLAAIDLDGTLLGPDATISAANRAAVARLAAAGIEVVLASGRHVRSMQSYARQLPEVRWLVSSQGAETGRADGSRVLARKFLRGSDVEALMSEEAQRGFTPVYYAADNVFAAAGGNADLDFYAALAGRTPAPAGRAEISRMPLQKIVWVGEARAISALRSDAGLAALGLQGVQTEERLYEFMPRETTKAAGLQVLVDELGMSPREVVAFGDGENDIPMFDWAGFSYAMPHGWKNALARAACTAPAGPRESAFARAVEMLLEAGGGTG